jgi:hypothetical protein
VGGRREWPASAAVMWLHAAVTVASLDGLVDGEPGEAGSLHGAELTHGPLRSRSGTTGADRASAVRGPQQQDVPRQAVPHRH